eukprot:1189360-Prymnesium_polylepis.1
MTPGSRCGQVESKKTPVPHASPGRTVSASPLRYRICPSRLVTGLERIVGHLGASVSAHTAPLGLIMQSSDDSLLPDRFTHRHLILRLSSYAAASIEVRRPRPGGARSVKLAKL